jgi:hypothetical protein
MAAAARREQRSHIASRAGMLGGEIAFEDLVRTPAALSVTPENFESIRNHCAYAEITGAGAALID